MSRKETTSKEDLMTIVNLLEETGIQYWIDGGWGVDLLAGKQTRTHRDIDVDFDARYTEELLERLMKNGYEIDTDWKPVRIELYSDKYGYLDIHPFVLEEDGTSRQADLEGGWYQFEKDFFGESVFEGRSIPCISLKGQKIFHTGYELRDKDRHDIAILDRIAEERMERCAWCLCNEEMVKYHDEEWGRPLHEDRKQFEFLMMEVMQCGLNWNMMIQKREIFRACFDGFDYQKVANYTEADIQRILETEGMIRSRRKIEAVIHNAQCFLKVREAFGTFSDYLWGFSKGKTILYMGHQKGRLPAKNGLSDAVSRDLKKRGFKYLGSVTVYSHLQACGIINDHMEGCFRYQAVTEGWPTVRKRRDQES